MSKWANFFEVSLSGYYEWIKSRAKRDERHESYRSAVKKAFESGKGTYGVDRVCGVIRKNGGKASPKKVTEYMKELGLKSIHVRRRQRSLTDSRKARDDSFPNLVKGIEITEPMKVITSDITYIKTGEGFEYQCIIRDVVSGMVLGHSMAERMTSDLVVKAFLRADAKWNIPKTAIFHSDRGSQYTSKEVKGLLQRYKIKQSFSRVGKPGDNAWSESFFANMKKERVHWQWFSTREQARQAIFEYIETFYNTRRVQKRLNYLSPAEWLKQNSKSNKMKTA